MKPSHIFMRGLAMGAADIVPGVSGGTVAFITGIYPRLLNAIRGANLTAARLLLRLDFAGLWRHLDGAFLAPLISGILISLFSLARVFSWVLQHYPSPMWALFFGLILASSVMLLRQVKRWSAATVAALALGVGCALVVALAPRTGFIPGYTGVFFAGFIALCAMIVPGISGSFLLVLMGMYPLFLAALKGFDLLFLGVFISGGICGLLSFARLLHWLLRTWNGATIALLTGFLLGSLVVVWPWKHVLAWYSSSSGGLKPAQQLPVLPQEFLARTGEDPLTALCVLCMVLGFALVWFVERRGGPVTVELD